MLKKLSFVAVAASTWWSSGCGSVAQDLGADPIEDAALAAVARRIDAFNANDIDAFLAAHTGEVSVIGYPDRVFGEGRAHLERIFGLLFAEGLGSAEVHEQWVHGRFVVSNETVVEDGDPQHIIFIYAVRDGAIESIWLIASAQEDAAGGVATVSPAEQAALDAAARSFDGFNAHDVDAYVGAHAENVAIYVFPDRLLANEREHLRRIFGPSLERGEGAVEVRGQMVLSNVVVTDERLGGDDASEHVIVIHTVEDGAISEIRLIEEESQ